jgi:hypothetical protein
VANAFISPFNTQTKHIQSFYARQHCYVSLKTLYPGEIRTRVVSSLPPGHTTSSLAKNQQFSGEWEFYRISPNTRFYIQSRNKVFTKPLSVAGVNALLFKKRNEHTKRISVHTCEALIVRAQNEFHLQKDRKMNERICKRRQLSIETPVSQKLKSERIIAG